MRRWILKPILLTMTGLFIAVLPAASQVSTTRGLLLGLHLGGASLAIENSERSSGAGAGIALGYGFNRNFTILVQGDHSSIDVRDQPDVDGTWAISHLDVALRFNFANSLRSWVPYLQGGFGSRFVSVEEVLTASPVDGVVKFSGGAVTFGGGVMLYANQHLAFDLGLLFSGGRFTDTQIGNVTLGGLDIEATSSRFNLGMSWWR
jgi:hypothetical protein